MKIILILFFFLLTIADGLSKSVRRPFDAVISVDISDRSVVDSLKIILTEGKKVEPSLEQYESFFCITGGDEKVSLSVHDKSIAYVLGLLSKQLNAYIVFGETYIALRSREHTGASDIYIILPISLRSYESVFGETDGFKSVKWKLRDLLSEYVDMEDDQLDVEYNVDAEYLYLRGRAEHVLRIEYVVEALLRKGDRIKKKNKGQP